MEVDRIQDFPINEKKTLPNAREIFENEVNKKYEKHKLEFDNYLKRLHIIRQIDTLKAWIKKIESLFEDDIDKLKDNYYTGISFNLGRIIQINFSGKNEYADFMYFRETKEFGPDYSAITTTDIHECLRNDTSVINLKYQLIIDELMLLKAYFSKKLTLLENNLSTKEDNLELINTLTKACNGKKEYESIKAWFIKEGLCNPDPFIFKITKKGDKSILINYLKELHPKGYSKELKQAEIIAIAKNSFGVSIGIDTVKTAKLKGKSEIPSFIK